MKEYTILALISIVLAVVLDDRLGTKVLRKKEYYIFLLVILFFKLIVNGFLTGHYIVVYNPDYFLGLRIGPIPIEDFCFGFSMVTLAVVFWEYFKGKQKATDDVQT